MFGYHACENQWCFLPVFTNGLKMFLIVTLMQNRIVFLKFPTENNLFINISIIRRCIRQWARHEDSAWHYSGEDRAHPSLWLCYPFQVSAALSVSSQVAILGVLMSESLLDVLSYESYVLHTSYRKDEFVTVYPADVVLFEGILMFYSQEIRDLFQMKLFVDTDPDTRLSRRGRCTVMFSIAFLFGFGFK